MSKKAKDIIKKVNKDLEIEKTREIKKEFVERAIESKNNELRVKASEYFSKKYNYIFDDLDEFKLEIRKKTKGIYYSRKPGNKVLFDHENAYSGDLTIAEIWFWIRGNTKEAKNLWRLAIGCSGLFTENHKLKIDEKNISKLVKPQKFKIYHTYQEGWSWEEGNYTHTNEYPMERYDAFIEKYVADITRKINEYEGEIIIKKEDTKKKKRFFFF